MIQSTSPLLKIFILLPELSIACAVTNNNDDGSYPCGSCRRCATWTCGRRSSATAACSWLPSICRGYRSWTSVRPPSPTRGSRRSQVILIQQLHPSSTTTASITSRRTTESRKEKGVNGYQFWPRACLRYIVFLVNVHLTHFPVFCDGFMPWALVYLDLSNLPKVYLECKQTTFKNISVPENRSWSWGLSVYLCKALKHTFRFIHLILTWQERIGDY